jgi:hypothetical protein
LQIAVLQALSGGPVDDVAVRYDIVGGGSAMLSVGDVPIHAGGMAAVSDLCAEIGRTGLAAAA